MTDSDEENNNIFMCNTKKRKKTGRMREVMKKLRVATHETGDDCRCKRLKCFESVSSDQRTKLIKDFNSMKCTDEQNIYLCGLMSVNSIKRRRSRKSEIDANFHQTYFSYKVRVIENDETREVPICYKAFISIFGITKGKLEHLQKSLKMTGTAPIDKRGKSSSNKRLDNNIKNLICTHIKSFKGRLSHYSLNDTKKEYLPEDLNIKKMYELYLDAYESQNHVSYETYRTIFNTEFNISFGFWEHPRVILHRSNYNGIWEKSPIVAKKGTGSDFSNEFELPRFAYQNFLPVSAEKYKDLMDLKRFCSEGAQSYFESIPHV